MVQTVIGSLSCMFQDYDQTRNDPNDPEDLTQVITKIDLEKGIFQFVDKWEIVASLKF